MTKRAIISMVSFFSYDNGTCQELFVEITPVSIQHEYILRDE